MDSCGKRFDDPAPLIDHQRTSHPFETCRICETAVPAGFLAIRHAFTEHRRSEYVRAYGAAADAIRRREEIVRQVQATIDLPDLLADLEPTLEPQSSASD